jgi:two-component system, NarL family, response regulator NreC
MQKTRILIADDHALFRQGMRSLIESGGGDFVVVGEAKDGLEAIAKAVELQPDTVLMDLCMPNQNGMESIGAIKRRAPHTRIIVVTGHCTEEHVRATLEAGADGYVLKDDTGDDLLKALRAAQEGKMFLSPGICGPLITGYLRRPSPGEAPGTESAAAPTAPARQAQTSWSQLTTRERQMLKLVAEGKKNREIATLLSLSAKTVEKHRANLMRKMGFGSVSELVAYALDNGLI